MFDDFSLGDYCTTKIYENVYQMKDRHDRINMRCPICGDSRKNKSTMRGWWYKNTNSYICWNDGCDASGTGMQGLYFVSRMLDEELSTTKMDYLNWLRGVDQEDREIVSYKQPVKELKKQLEFEIPDHWHESNDTTQQVLEARRIMDAPYAPRNWKFYYNTHSKRMVIPWMRYGETKYYQERSLYKNQTPKYLFPYNSVKDVFGVGSVDQWFPYLFWTEGCLDSIFIRNCVAVGGVIMTNEQEKLLSDRFPLIDLCWFPDNPYVDTTTCRIIHERALTEPTGLVFMWDKTTAKDVNDDVIISDNVMKYTDEEYLISHIMTYVKASVTLKWGML